MPEWTAADLAGMELCRHGERLKFCPECSQGVSSHPAASRLTTAPVAPSRAILPPALGRLPKPKRGPNKWETEFASRLQNQQDSGLIVWYQFEGQRFRLADGAWYKPDFVALSHTGELIVYECKGFWRESARVRIKVAADRHPFRFIAVTKRRQKDGGGWAEEMFSAALDRMDLSRFGRKD